MSSVNLSLLFLKYHFKLVIFKPIDRIKRSSFGVYASVELLMTIKVNQDLIYQATGEGCPLANLSLCSLQSGVEMLSHLIRFLKKKILNFPINEGFLLQVNEALMLPQQNITIYSGQDADTIINQIQ